MHYIESAYRNNCYKLKGWLFKLYLLLHGCRVGKNLKCLAFPRIRSVPKGNIEIGDHVAMGRNITLEITSQGKLILDDHALLADNIVLSSSSLIHMKKWSAVAENSSIRDHFHKMKKDKAYRMQESVAEPVVLGEDSGVGAGSVVLMGSKVPDGAFIGANSVITKHDKLEPYGIYSGHPVKLVKYRE